MTTTTAPRLAAALPRLSQIASKGSLSGIVLLFIVAMSFVSPVFLSISNFRNLLIQSTILAVLALGQTFVIMVRGIDLSIGGIMALSSSLAVGLTATGTVPVGLAIPIALAVGAGAGALNGLAVTRLGITPLIVTLAMLSAARGAVFVYTNGANLSPVPDTVISLASTQVFGLPLSVWLLVLLAVAAHLVLSRYGVWPQRLCHGRQRSRGPAGRLADGTCGHADLRDLWHDGGRRGPHSRRQA